MKQPTLAVDTIIRTKDDKIVLVKRKFPPFEDSWALPGGIVEYGETVENAAVREAKEETGLEVMVKSLVGVYSDPSRDPRGHVISICYLCDEIGGTLAADTDAKVVRTFTAEEYATLELAFDHKMMLRDSGIFES
ncbi:MAG: NUDIX domain-containing protein [Candidatus Hodarchaeota archaeon]